jgi:hypothetical protein
MDSSQPGRPGRILTNMPDGTQTTASSELPPNRAWITEPPPNMTSWAVHHSHVCKTKQTGLCEWGSFAPASNKEAPDAKVELAGRNRTPVDRETGSEGRGQSPPSPVARMDSHTGQHPRPGRSRLGTREASRSPWGGPAKPQWISAIPVMRTTRIRRSDCRIYSSLMLVARTTLPHFSVSSAMSFAKSADEPPSAVTPKSARRDFTLASARPALIS